MSLSKALMLQLWHASCGFAASMRRPYVWQPQTLSALQGGAKDVRSLHQPGRPVFDGKCSSISSLASRLLAMQKNGAPDKETSGEDWALH